VPSVGPDFGEIDYVREGYIDDWQRSIGPVEDGYAVILELGKPDGHVTTYKCRQPR
jgi:hypothetical protein